MEQPLWTCQAHVVHMCITWLNQRSGLITMNCLRQCGLRCETALANLCLVVSNEQFALQTMHAAISVLTNAQIAPCPGYLIDSACQCLYSDLEAFWELLLYPAATSRVSTPYPRNAPFWQASHYTQYRQQLSSQTSDSTTSCLPFRRNKNSRRRDNRERNLRAASMETHPRTPPTPPTKPTPKAPTEPASNTKQPSSKGKRGSIVQRLHIIPESTQL
jgi:hypothetical protein